MLCPCRNVILNDDVDLALRGKVVMVTGGAGRIGPVICATFAREGALIGVLDIAGERAEATAASLRQTGAQAIGLPADVSRSADVDRALRDLTAALGPVDVLVNAHGISDRKSTRLNSSHGYISYAVFCLKKKNR